MIGRVFWRGPVRELVDGETPDFAVLEARDFIRRRSGSSLAGEREFAFKHALTREVAYASLPKARRARLHAGFADWLERDAEGREEHGRFLAHHYAEAVGRRTPTSPGRATRRSSNACVSAPSSGSGGQQSSQSPATSWTRRSRSTSVRSS